MKKLLTTIALTTMIATSSFAAVEQKKTNDHKWSVKFTGYTTNDNMPDQWNDLHIGYKLGVTYNINKNFYVQGTGIMVDRNHYMLEALTGFQFDLTKHFKPYAEISGDFYSYRGKDNRALNYDVGLNFNIYHGLYVGAETGNFFESKYGYYKFKAGVPVAKDLVLSASYDLKYQGHYNGISASIEYLI
jgi:hypothetical protein